MHHIFYTNTHIHTRGIHFFIMIEILNQVTDNKLIFKG